LNPIGDLERPGSHAGEQFCKIFLKSINLKSRYSPNTKVGQMLKTAIPQMELYSNIPSNIPSNIASLG